MKRNLVTLIPLLIFVLLCGFLYQGLYGNPREIESVRIGKPMPAFKLPDLMADGTQWRETDLNGEPYLLNVWGTWCPTCLAELGYLTELKQQGVKIVGLYYEQGFDPDFDDSFDIKALRTEVNEMLNRAGNPYAFNILDLKRELALDLGVTGAPETFLVDAKGTVLLHHVGDINPRVWRAKFAPLMQEVAP